ncbi:MAG: putative aminohydrolase SsnA [Oscillibacter sp.]|jgi:putative selenium metabolism protein SsnA|nr:putative aminohydrolase SsnA [Oscillibacter sp.]
MILLANGRVITRDAEGTGYFENGGVVTDGGKIVAVGPTAELKAKYPQAEFVDAKGGVIMPGLINAHTHIYSALARGLSITGNNPTNFYEVLDGTWWAIDRHLDLQMTKASAQALVLDSIKQGVTTIFDHHASFCEIPGSLFEIAEVTKELGMRACLCYEVSDRDGEEKSIQSVKENADFITYCEKNPSDMLKAMFGGHALFTISDKTFDRMNEANDGRVGYHIHVSEGMNDVYDSLQNYGRRPVQRLQDHNILGPKTILGHCIHVNTAEMDIIKATDTMCVNNPESNMGNAVGISPILQLYKKGILVGMGTDAYTNDMLESIKVALCSQRNNACMPNVAWCEVTDMLFKNNAKMAQRTGFPEMGVLKPGAAADVIVMDYKPYTPFSDANIDGHMLFGMTGRQCQTTMINGKILYKDRAFVDIDEEAINASVMEQSKKLWGALNHCKY